MEIKRSREVKIGDQNLLEVPWKCLRITDFLGKYTNEIIYIHTHIFSKVLKYQRLNTKNVHRPGGWEGVDRVHMYWAFKSPQDLKN